MKLSLFKRQTPQDKFKETLEKYQKAAEENPSDLRIHVKIAELYLENDKKYEAIQEYLLAARAYQEKRLFQIAVAIYNHAISINPDEVSIYTELANLHLRNGFVGDGVAVLEKLANHYYEKEMRFEAAQVLQKIREIDPNNEFFKIKVAKFYKNKDISEEETLRAGPKDKWELVEEKKNTGKDALDGVAAEGFFDLASALDEDDITINISTVAGEEDSEGQGTSEGMNPDEVFQQLRSLMASEPDQDSPQFHYNLGLAYQRCNQFEEAVDEFKAAVEGIEDQVDCCIRLADCSMALNRFEEAQAVIGRALKFEDLSEEQKMGLVYQSGLIYKAMGDTKSAVKVFKKIYATNKNYKSVGMHIKELTSQ